MYLCSTDTFRYLNVSIYNHKEDKLNVYTKYNDWKLDLC